MGAVVSSLCHSLSSRDALDLSRDFHLPQQHISYLLTHKSSYSAHLKAPLVFDSVSAFVLYKMKTATRAFFLMASSCKEMCALPVVATLAFKQRDIVILSLLSNMNEDFVRENKSGFKKMLFFSNELIDLMNAFMQGPVKVYSLFNNRKINLFVTTVSFSSN